MLDVIGSAVVSQGTVTVFCIFRDYISDMLDSEKKFICFAHHKVVIDGICEVIDEKKKE
jgi:hypothetical protein